MISLSTLADLAAAHRSDLDLPVAPLQVGDRTLDLDSRPALMASVNLSHDSTYRDSIAPSAAAAVRRGVVMAEQGADIVDIGAESSTVRAARVGAQGQIAALVPVVEQLAARGVLVSAETYLPEVVEAVLAAGATMLNFTGAAHEDEIFDLAARHSAAVVLCHVRGSDVREVTDVEVASDPLPAMLDYFAARIDKARSRGVDRLIIDPGMGFYYGNLTDAMTRARHQTMVLLNSFRLRRLGVPVLHALPHSLDIFEEAWRTAEGFYAVLAHLGGAGMFRTHEVVQLRGVLQALTTLDVFPPQPSR